MLTTVGLVAEDDRREILKSELSRFGFSVAPRNTGTSKLHALLIDGSLDQYADKHLKPLSKESVQPCFIAVLAPSHLYDQSASQGIALSPSISSFAQQLRIHLRQQDIKAEAELRKKTLSSLGSDFVFSNPSPGAGNCLLYYGEPGAFYLKFKAEMARKGYATQAVLTERTAFEALRTHRPSAFVVHVQETFFPYELLDHIQGRPDLKSMPVIGLSEMCDPLPENLDHLSALIRFGARFADAATALAEQVEHSLVSAPLHAPDCVAPARDAYANCFSEEYGRLHLQEQARYALETSTDLTGIVLEPFLADSGELLEAIDLPPFSTLLSTLLRGQDFCCRIDWKRFVVTMPGTDIARATDAFERARRVMEATPSKTGSFYSFRFKAVELEDIHSSDHFARKLFGMDFGKSANPQSNVA